MNETLDFAAVLDQKLDGASNGVRASILYDLYRIAACAEGGIFQTQFTDFPKDLTSVMLKDRTLYTWGSNKNTFVDKGFVDKLRGALSSYANKKVFQKQWSTRRILNDLKSRNISI